ncbi:MAG TPA: cytochrome c oxidase subunit 3 [Actinomycetota bacterium]|nr:cytochrome c oxidase subunit 3 [Actinomycetota bacterium]
MSTATAVRPAVRPGSRPRTTPLLVVGIVLFLGSELMFFASLFGMYFTLRAQNRLWTPQEVVVDTYRVAFTLALVASSFTMQHAVTRLKRGDRAGMRRWIWITILLGVVFLGGQINEWIDLPFRIHTDAYGSAFYTMTGFHGLHVLAGLLLMLVILGRAAKGAYTPDEHAGVEVATYYWHFVDVVWIALFVVLFVIR